MSDLSVLWQPLEIGPHTVSNRIFVSPHQTGYAAEAKGSVSDRYAAYLGERARGGAGLVITEVACVHPYGSRRLAAWNPEIQPGWRKLASAVHEHGGKVFTQLWHPGAHEVGNGEIDGWYESVAPSELPSMFTGRVARTLATKEIGPIVETYAASAESVRAGGIDGVEVHAGHGYLPCQFLSPLTNRRSDDYGGSLENRCRFLVEIGGAIRRRVGRDFAVGVRLSFDEYVGEAGLTPSISESVVKLLAATGNFDYFSISGGNYHSMHRMIPPAQAGLDGHIAPNAARAKAASGGLPVFVASAVRTVERAADIVSADQADMVAMTRAHLADPELVTKAMEGRGEEIRLCVGANQSCQRRLMKHGSITCTVNPAAGREARLSPRSLRRAGSRLRVAIAGGGPAGMKAAETAAQRGHHVWLLERGDTLGGQLLSAGRLPRREGWLRLAEDLSNSVDRLGVNVLLGTEAGLDSIASLRPDRVLVATGSHFVRGGYSHADPEREAIPGASAEHVLDPVTAITDPDRCGPRVLIFDDVGDHLPLGLALKLAETGREVEVVTRHLHLGASGLAETGDLPWLQTQLTAAGVSQRSQSKLGSIGNGWVEVESIWGGRAENVPAETVVLNTVRRTDDRLHRELDRHGFDPIRIGDCLAPREVDDAIYEGADRASLI